MSLITVGDSALHVLDQGEGQAIVFVHGVMASGRFFQRQVEHFAASHRVIVPDLRGHGASEKSADRHTVAAYADDLHALLQQLNVAQPVLVGWSMGAMIGYELLRRHGADSLAGLMIIDQPPSDFAWPDYPYGFFTPEILDGTLEQLQTEPRSVIEFLVGLTLHQPDPDTTAWMTQEMLKVPASIAASILVSQTLKDYRPFLPEITVPTLVAVGSDPKLTPPDAGRYIAEQVPNAHVELFEHSSHAPFWEEPDKFNRVLDEFLNQIS